jgi:hypothetical protein
MNQFTFSSLFVLGALSACSSGVRKPVQVENLKTKLEVIQPLQSNHSSTVGLRDGVVIVQSKKSVPESIRKLENSVFILEDEIYGNRMLGNPGLYGVLKKCLMQLSDKRIGGNGKLISIENEDRPTMRDDEIRFGLDEQGRVVSVNEESAADHMARYMEYHKVLTERRREFETRIDVCDQDYRNALAEAALPGSSELQQGPWTLDTRGGTKAWKGLSSHDEELLRSRNLQSISAKED